MKYLIRILIIFQMQILTIFANQEIDKINLVINKFPEVNLPFKFSDVYESNDTKANNYDSNNSDTLNLESIILLFNIIYPDLEGFEFSKFFPIGKILLNDVTILIIREECAAGGWCEAFYLTIINKEQSKINTFFLSAAGADKSGIWTFSGKIDKNLKLIIQNKEYKTIEKPKYDFDKLIKTTTTKYKIDPIKGNLKLIKK